MSLLGSAAVATGAAFGGIWSVRLGVLIAIIGGSLACFFAWREAKVERKALLAAQAADSRQAADQLHSERVQHVRLLQVLQSRNGELRSKLNTARAEVAKLSQDSAQLRGDKAALEAELAEREAAAQAEVVTLPRRVSGRGDDVDIWNMDGAPTVVELQILANPPVDEGEQRQHA